MDVHSLIRDRKVAFANLVRAYLKFNVPSVTQCEVLEDGNLQLNNAEYKFDVDDYTGGSERYVFMNTRSGRIVIEKGNVNKVYKVDVDLIDHQVD